MNSTTKIFTLISAAGILYYYYKKWVSYNEELQKQTWPLKYPSCPDYWDLTDKGLCRNKYNLGTCPMNDNDNAQKQDGVVDFTTAKSKTLALSAGQTAAAKKEALEARCNWARQCKVSWEGIDRLCA